MDRAHALRVLGEHAAELRARGIRHMSLFGSTARVEAQPDSDVDLLIELSEGHRLTLIDLVRLRDDLSAALNAPTDVTIRRNIKPLLLDSILGDEVRVF